ncbi:Exocyst complex component 2 [Homalodisca vitripennis]|nr:Exocyst complex component 2 [Homalodisca vitripennis]
MVSPPVVTGISPKEGPPGTRVTIRGENLGKKPQDLISLTICGCDCLLSAEWKSPNKIIARSGPGKGRGDIIVVTASGGKGTSTVQFRGYHETIGPLKESAVWVEEAPLQTLAWGRRSLSPTSYQMEDPLGLSVEGNEKKFPEDDLHELFPEGSGDLASDQFEPGWFLLEHHHGTSFDDLRVGLGYLRRKVEGQKEGQLSFLKANVGSVMEQLDTLFILKEKFETDVMERGIDPTIKMEKAIRDSMLEANKLFEGVLKRRERADATRNALGVLQRFRFLFTLPVTIERNIQRGEYDAVINDYARAQNLFGKTEVVVFKKVLSEVEQKINDLRELLKAKLQDMPTPLHVQKKIIRNLVHVDCEGDPVWDAINVHYNYITQLTLCIVTLVWNVIAGTWYTWTVRGTQNLVHVDCEGDPVWDAINVHYNYITQQMTLCIVTLVWNVIAGTWYTWTVRGTQNLVHVDCEGDPVWDAINVHYNYITQLTLCIVTLVWTVIAGTWYTWTVRGTQNLVHLDCEGDPVWDAINVHYNYITQQMTLCTVTLVWNVIAGTWYTWTVRGTQNLVHVDCEGDPVWDAINVHYNYITQLTLCIVTLVWTVIAGTWYTWTVRGTQNLVHVDCEGDPVWDAINVHYNYITQQLTLCKEKHLAAETSSEESVESGTARTGLWGTSTVVYWIARDRQRLSDIWTYCTLQDLLASRHIAHCIDHIFVEAYTTESIISVVIKTTMYDADHEAVCMFDTFPPPS